MKDDNQNRELAIGPKKSVTVDAVPILLAGCPVEIQYRHFVPLYIVAIPGRSDNRGTGHDR